MTATAASARNETFYAIHQAVLTSLAAVTILWEGVELTQPPTGKWMRVSMRHVTGRQASLANVNGARRWIRTGFVIVQCFAPKAANGVTEATLLATTVRDALQGQSTQSCVWFRDATINEVGVDKDWYQVNAVINFEYDEVDNASNIPPGLPDPPPPQFVYNFPTPSLQWVINHNLGRRATVEAYTMGGTQIWAQVNHISDNQSVVLFDTPQDGYAIIDY